MAKQKLLNAILQNIQKFKVFTCGVNYCPLHLPLPRPLPDHQDVVATPLPLLPGQPVPRLLVSYYLSTSSLLFSSSLIIVMIDHYLSCIFTDELPRSKLRPRHHALALAGNVHNVEMRVGTILHHSVGTPACRQLVQFMQNPYCTLFELSLQMGPIMKLIDG